MLSLDKPRPILAVLVLVLLVVSCASTPTTRLGNITPVASPAIVGEATPLRSPESAVDVSPTQSAVAPATTTRTLTTAVIPPTKSATSLMTATSQTPNTPSPLAFPFSSSLTNPGVVWIGDMDAQKSTMVVSAEGEIDELNVSVRAASPDGTYAIFVNPVLGYSNGLNIANLEKRTVVHVANPDKPFFTAPISDNFVFSPSGNRFAALLMASNKPGWDLIAVDSESGNETVLLRDADFRKTDARTRPDETLVPIAWRPEETLFLQSIRPNTDANFGTLLWTLDKDTWQRIETTGIPAVSNDGKKLVYVAYDAAFSGAGIEGANVVKVVDNVGHGVNTISSTGDSVRGFGFPLLDLLAWSPDDRQVLFLGRGFDAANGKSGIVLRIADPQTGQYKEIALEPDGEITDVEWTQTGIFYLVTNERETRLKRLDPRKENAVPELVGMMDGAWSTILKVWE